MEPTSRARVAAIVLLCTFGCFSPRVVHMDERVHSRPNIVLLMADDHGWGELGRRGHPYLATPALDAMAASGLSLERFYAAAPVCSPTRASVLTGRHPNRMGCFVWGHEVPGDEWTLAEALRERGYATGHFGKWHVGSLVRGAATSPGEQGFDEWVSSPNYYDLDPEFSDRGTVIETHGEGSQVTVDLALSFIRRAHREGRPFLAVVWFGSPHLPHHAPPEELARRSDVPESMRAYCAEIEALDASVGRLRDELRWLDIANETLVWYTSDNGPLPPDDGDASTDGLRGRKKTLFEGGLRVPCFLEWPGRIPVGLVSLEPAGTVDIFPTLLELAGAAVPDEREYDGVSLTPLLDGAPWTRSAPLGFWFHEARGRGMHSDQFLRAIDRGLAPLTPPPTNVTSRAAFERGELSGDAAWIDGAFKLHRFDEAMGVRYELYDLASDPTESVDLAPGAPGRVERMSAALEAWRAAVARDWAYGARLDLAPIRARLEWVRDRA